MAKETKEKKALKVVLANGNAADADLLRELKPGVVDLKITATGQVITSSPLDPTGTRPDFHFWVDVAADEAKKDESKKE